MTRPILAEACQVAGQPALGVRLEQDDPTADHAVGWGATSEASRAEER